MGQPYVRREARVKAEVLQLIDRSPLPVRQTLKELQIAPSSYYRWRAKYGQRGLTGLEDRPSVPQKVCACLRRSGNTWCDMPWSIHP